MRHAIQTVLAAAAITATITALHEASFAALPKIAVGPRQMMSSTSLQPASAYGFMPPVTPHAYLPQSLAFGDASQLKAYFGPSQLTFFDDAIFSYPSSISSQQVSLGRAAKSAGPMDTSRADAMSDRHRSPNSTRGAVFAPPHQLMAPIVRIQFSAPALAPMAHTFFCLKYRKDCRIHKMVFRGGPVVLTTERLAELKRINAAVNRAITPEPNTRGLANEKWLVSPRAGECHDYAVTKRHELLARGWPERALLLSEVVTASGEHHLVLVVRTSEGDLVADNLNGNIRRWSKTSYEWVRIQSPTNPMFWSTITSTTVLAKETVLNDAKS